MSPQFQSPPLSVSKLEPSLEMRSSLLKVIRNNESRHHDLYRILTVQACPDRTHCRLTLSRTMPTFPFALWRASWHFAHHRSCDYLSQSFTSIDCRGDLPSPPWWPITMSTTHKQNPSHDQRDHRPVNSTPSRENRTRGPSKTFRPIFPFSSFQIEVIVIRNLSKRSNPSYLFPKSSTDTR